MRSILNSLPVVALLVFTTSAPADDKKPEVTEERFRAASRLLLDDPLHKDAQDAARLIVVFTLESKHVAIFIGEDGLAWITKKKEKHEFDFLLMGAYMAGNAQAQLDSGVKRHEPYPGVLAMFRVYRLVQKKDNSYKIPEVDELLSLLKEGKLMRHLADLQAEKKIDKPIPIDIIKNPK